MSMTEYYQVGADGGLTYGGYNPVPPPAPPSQGTTTPGTYAGLTPQQAVQLANERARADTAGRPQTTTDEWESGPDRLRSILAPFGLEGVAQRAWDYYQYNTPSQEELMYWLRQQPEYAARFPAMKKLNDAGHAITERDYINLETDYKQRFRAAGLPPGFYDQPSDFTSYIELEVSPVELQARLDEYTAITYSLPPIVRDEMTQKYGFTAGDITAYIIDPERALPILHNQVLAAQVGGGARQAGFGSLTTAESEQLAQLGLDFNSAVKGFGVLANSQQLFTPLAGDAGESAIDRATQIAAVGGNPAAQRRIEQRGRKRTATFQEGGSFAGGGFGNAST